MNRTVTIALICILSGGLCYLEFSQLLEDVATQKANPPKGPEKPTVRQTSVRTTRRIRKAKPSTVVEETKDKQSVSAKTNTPATSGQPSREVTLLTEARHVLRAGDPESALALIKDAMALPPTTRVKEELMAVKVMAFIKLNRRDEAHDAMANFKKQYPNSRFEREVQLRMNEQRSSLSK